MFINLNRKRADLIILVLESQGIRTSVEKHDGLYDVLVHEEDEKHALRCLEKFFEENRYFGIKKRLESIPVSSFNSYTAFFMMAVISVIHIFSTNKGIHKSLIHEYGSSALYIFQGEYFRSVTALMLHSDFQHLAGNLAGLLLFAAPLITITGYGSGSLLLILTGAAGNLINAYYKHNAVLSIGTSTMVMSAAGLLTAFTIIQKEKVNFRKFLPLAAGATIVAMLSGGERTDISAHIFGFLSGLVTGLVYFHFNRTGKVKRENQYLVLAIFICIAAWFKFF